MEYVDCLEPRMMFAALSVSPTTISFTGGSKKDGFQLSYFPHNNQGMLITWVGNIRNAKQQVVNLNRLKKSRSPCLGEMTSWRFSSRSGR